MKIDKTDKILYIALVFFLVISNIIYDILIFNCDKNKFKSQQEMQNEIEILRQEVQYLIRDYNKIEDELKCLKREDKRFPCAVGDSNG